MRHSAGNQGAGDMGGHTAGRLKEGQSRSLLSRRRFLVVAASFCAGGAVGFLRHELPDIVRATGFSMGDSSLDYSIERLGDFSPLEQKLAFESRYFSFDRAGIKAIYDSITKSVMKSAMRSEGTRDISSAMGRILADDRKRKRTIESIAKELIKRNVIVYRESLFADAFTPGDKVHYHMDCDLLSFTFREIADRIRLPVQIHFSPLHAYIVLESAEKGKGYPVETTAFRKSWMYSGRNEGSSIYTSSEMGDAFWSSIEEQKKKIMVPEWYARLNRFFTDASNEEINRYIKASVFTGAMSYAFKKGDIGLALKIQDDIENSLKQDGMNYLIITNLRNDYIRISEELARRKRPRDSLIALQRAYELEGSPGYSKYFTNASRLALFARGRLFVRAGSVSEGLRDLIEFVDSERQNQVRRDISSGWQQAEAQYLIASMLAKERRSGDFKRIYYTYLEPGINLGLNSDIDPLPSFYKDMVGLSIRLLESSSPISPDRDRLKQLYSLRKQL